MNKGEGLIPVITIDSVNVGELLQVNKDQEEGNCDGIIGYLVANVDYNSFVGNPLIKIIGIDQGRQKEGYSEDVVFPNATRENQISIRYESIIHESDDETDTSFTFDSILETQQLVFQDETPIFRITCIHEIFPSYSFFKFYMPFSSFETTFTELNERAPRMKKTIGAKPYIDVKTEKDAVYVTFRNISKYQLNIS